MWDWIHANRNWFLSGLGVAILTYIGKIIWSIIRTKKEVANDIQLPVTITNQNIMNIGKSNDEKPEQSDYDLDAIKAKAYILFIDDDTKFKVVDILKKSGWSHTKRVTDVSSIDDEKIVKAHILFIDIHGVGRKIHFHDEGLGLVNAIKEKYPYKKIVIYSAQSKGDRFHGALRKADASLAKNADPYEFQQLAERLAKEVISVK